MGEFISTQIKLPEINHFGKILLNGVIEKYCEYLGRGIFMDEDENEYYLPEVTHWT